LQGWFVAGHEPSILSTRWRTLTRTAVLDEKIPASAIERKDGLGYEDSMNIAECKFMRKLDRRGIQVPQILLSETTRQARSKIEAILRLPYEERVQRRIPVNEQVFTDSELVHSLTTLSNGKCSFCESIQSDEALVHHFRPIMNAANEPENAGELHHYAWLTYEWKNLFASCPDCVRNAKSLFPVKGHRATLFLPIDEIRSTERFELIDPEWDNPSEHLEFLWNGLLGYLSDRGRRTISVFELNSTRLRTSRKREFAEFIQALKEYAQYRGAVRSALVEMLSPDAKFLGAKENLLNRFVGDLKEAGNITRRFNARRPFESLTDILDDADERILEQVFSQIESEIGSEELDEGDALDRRLRNVEAVEYRPEYKETIVFRPQRRKRYQRLRAVTITSFKAIQTLRLELPERRRSKWGTPCMMLIGENASGKSSILEGIALACCDDAARGVIARTPSEFLRRNLADQWGIIDPQPAKITLSFHGEEPECSMTIDSQGSAFHGNPNNAPTVLAYGPRRYFVQKKRGIRKTQADRVRTLFDPSASISYPLHWLQKLTDADFYAVARALREVLSLDEGDSIVRNENNGTMVRHNGSLAPLERMSEGYKSLFVLVADIARELLLDWPDLEGARAIVLIDEIETHLHPRWKMKVMSSLRTAFPEVTFIATTHDPLCLHGLDDGEVHVLYRDSDGRIGLVPDLPSIRGMRADQLLTSDYFGLNSTVDPDAEKLVSDFVVAASSASAKDKSTLDVLAQEITKITTGDTYAEQLVAEALGQALSKRRGVPLSEKSAARERAIKTVLNALRISEE